MDQRARVDELEELREQVAYLEGVIRNLTGQDDDPVPGLTPLQCRMVRALERAQGRHYAIEVKPDGAYQSPAQKERQAALEAAGGRYAVCRSLEDVAEVLAEWEIPTRISITGARA